MIPVVFLGGTNNPSGIYRHIFILVSCSLQMKRRNLSQKQIEEALRAPLNSSSSSSGMTDSIFQSIDESMVKLKGRSTLKQYLPLKPIKRGVKIWERCDAKTGYVYDLNVYSGKDTNQVTGTLGERVVTKLCASVRNPHVLLSFDRFFTSVNLMQNLQFPAVGTVIKNRKNVPKFTAKLKRGESEFRVSEHGVMAARWMDSNDVIALSNCHQPVNNVVTRRQKDGKKVAVNCPDVFVTYNDIMGGVDLSDQKVSLYDFNRKSLKWWKKVFYKLLMTSVVNSHIIFQAATNSKSPLKQFIVELAEQLITKGRSTAKVTRRTSQTVGPRSKRSKKMLSIGDHMPVNSEGRRR